MHLSIIAGLQGLVTRYLGLPMRSQLAQDGTGLWVCKHIPASYRLEQWLGFGDRPEHSPETDKSISRISLPRFDGLTIWTSHPVEACRP